MCSLLPTAIDEKSQPLLEKMTDGKRIFVVLKHVLDYLYFSEKTKYNYILRRERQINLTSNLSKI